MASRDPAKETIAAMVARMVVLVEEKGDTLTPANTLRHAGESCQATREKTACDELRVQVFQ